MNSDPGYAVSVVVPCAGNLADLPDLVTALTLQDMPAPSWEVVFVDNGISPSGKAVLREQITRLTNAKVVTEPEPGIGPARNRGVQAASGGTLVFVDADDVPARTWLRAIVEAVEPGVIAGGHLDLELLNPAWLATTRGRHEPGTLYRCEGIFPVPPGGNLAISRADFDVIGGFANDRRSLEDFDLAIRAWDRGITVRPAGLEATVHYRLRASPASLYRQGTNYGIARASIYSVLWQRGLVRRWSFGGWKSWLLLVAVVLRGPFSNRYRCTAAWIAGNRIGRVRGSVRHRVLYL